MILEEARKAVVAYGRKLIDSGLTRGTGGNLSLFDRRERLWAVSPSGLDYHAVGGGAGGGRGEAGRGGGGGGGPGGAGGGGL